MSAIRAFAAASIAALLLASPAHAGQTQHQKLDAIAAQLRAIDAKLATLVRQDDTKPADPVKPGDTKPPEVKPPVAVVTVTGINYGAYAGMTPQEIMGAFGPFGGRGLPPGWDWNQAYAAGVINPDAQRKPPDASNQGGTTAGCAAIIPWNPPGSGQYLRCSGQSFTFYIVPPAGFSGTREIVIAQVPSPFQTQFDSVTVAFDGALLARGGQGLHERTGPMVGGRSYPVSVALDKPGAFSIQLP